ncbi:MAG: hypothetical protein MJ212_01845 [Alphaproteobacteria bacterium]|nr:hypothetical protein [Alphaproteobacteria bacterium]
MSNLWRIHLFGDAEGDSKNEARTYCIKNKIMAIGWPCWIKHDDVEEYLKKYKLVEGWTKKNGNCKDPVNRIIEQVQENDYVWTYDKQEGRYCIAKVVDKQAHIPVPSDDKLFKWFGVYRSVENWCYCDNFEVPGKVINGCIKGQTLQAVDSCLFEYSKYLYQKKHTKNPNLIFKQEENSEDTLKNLLHYDDLEDLLGLWLQIGNEYVVFPSTNKQGTKDYEYILKKKDGSRKAVIQCKTGYSGIDASKFNKYVNDDYNVYLATTFGIISNKPENMIEINNQNSKINDYSAQMYSVSIKYLLDWAAKNEKILPDRIKYYLEITGYLNTNKSQ